ncbi:uncharacterized protein LOC117245021 isoform X2 [Parus major]|uniref:uncharacterized protein LOC117245021 isoform X2 n=1 Tax=Parus major TaxID=9157 RepID=UPI0014443B48|nr:uncharacterized protein LOC117245021 isoform X2 [Parus major]
MERLARGLIKPEMRLQLPACIAPTLPRLQLPACIAPTLPRLQLPACIALTPPRLQLPACIALTPPAGVGRRLAERRGIAGPRGERAAERCGQGRSRVPGGSGSAPAHRRDRQQGNAHIQPPLSCAPATCQCPWNSKPGPMDAGGGARVGPRNFRSVPSIQGGADQPHQE